MKKSLVSILAIAIVLAVLSLYATRVHAQPSTDVIQTSATATTTVGYMTAGTASTTYQIDGNGSFASGKVANMQPIDVVSMFVQYSASSTSATLIATPQWSNNGIDWYGFGQSVFATPASTGVIPLASTTLTYQFLPPSTATTTFVINLPQINAQHERVIFGTQGANGAVYSEWVLRKNPSTP